MRENEITPRDHLILAALDFADRASQLEGVIQIALIGSLTTHKARPKDADVLVTIDESVDLKKLAEIGRRLKGKTQNINCGADIFLINAAGKYLGRTCHWRDCRPGVRLACQALNCGQEPHLRDDLQILTLPEEVTLNPPLIIYPEVIIKKKLPADLMNRVKQRSDTIKIHA